MESEAKKIREPIVVVLGHVDAGKTSLLDKLRGTAVQEKEAGGITQHIGASLFPSDVLVKLSKGLLDKFKIKVEIPGILFIDTPGHEAFANLRYRGGSAADIAIVVVDVTKGVEPQTVESINILKEKKVPFLVALNKIDLIAGWRPHPELTFDKDLSMQDKATQKLLDDRIYTVMGQLSSLGFESEAFYRVTNFMKQVSLVPVSAATGEGIPELLTVLLGLVQNFMKGKLSFRQGPGNGIIIEVKEEEGMGTVLNVILINGILSVNDKVVTGTDSGAKSTKIKGIYLPKPLDEMRDPRDKFKFVKSVMASAGVSVLVSDSEGIVAGAPIYVVTNEEEEKNYSKMIEEELRSLTIKTDQVGVIVKVDTLGSLEAFSYLLKQTNVPIRYAEIGPVTKKDVMEAQLVRQNDKYLGVILAFNQKSLVENPTVPIFTGNVMYNLIQDYLNYVKQEKEKDLRLKAERLTYPAKFQVLKGYVFRRSNPAIFGIRVLAGILKPKVRVMNEKGEEVGSIEQIQVQGESLQKLGKGEEAAVSMKNVTIGRHIKEDEVLYTLPSADEVKALKDSELPEEDKQVLKEIIEIRRKVEYLYGY
ncbi:MAG: translation initiation factor IF-2 [Nitrososphaeria archaeon]|nr:translation initiation factor IF-2 [Conexivisphaerales archaeon]